VSDEKETEEICQKQLNFKKVKISKRKSASENQEMSGSIIEVKTQAQIETVAKLADVIWRRHYVGMITLEQVEYMLAHFQSVDAVRAHIAQGVEYALIDSGERVCGYLAVFPDREDAGMMLSKIYVDHASRHQGLGMLALDWVVRRARREHKTFIWLTVNKLNTESIEWYQKNGFVIESELLADIGQGFVMDDYKMVKRLDA
jgi:ribosomal protein S18 acetylase RimI-like enzyme